MAVVTTDHEALGHGSACLALGGDIRLLTSVYMNCAGGNALVAACGPLMNLAMGALAWLALRRGANMRAHLRLFALLVMALSWFWEAGYLLYAMALDTGDSAIAARAIFGAPEWPWRIAGFVVGIALYAVAIRAVTSAARAFVDASVLRVCWLAASTAAVLAAAFYAPGRLPAMGQAALEIGAASVPLLGRFAQVDGSVIGRNARWIAFALAVYAIFLCTLGHGLPWAAAS
jgi:hypothetical protein